MCKFSCRKGLRPSQVLVNMFHSKRIVAMKSWKENLKVVRTYEWSMNRLQLAQFQTLGSQSFLSIIGYGHIYFRNAEWKTSFFVAVSSLSSKSLVKNIFPTFCSKFRSLRQRPVVVCVSWYCLIAIFDCHFGIQMHFRFRNSIIADQKKVFHNFQ